MREHLPKFAIDESSKEVFFHIGVAFMAAQSFEESLLGMLTGLYVTENPTNWRENFKRETESLTSMTLGKLLAKARKVIPFDQEVDSTLQFALEKRNRLIHGFYHDSFGLMADRRGHKKLIDELVGLRNLFRKAEEMIAPLSHQLMLKVGMTKEQMFNCARRGIEDQLREHGLIGSQF